MASVLIREKAPKQAYVLVHGAGGGLELEAFARETDQWSFLGVVPALPMLDEVRRRLRALNDRVTLHHGLIDDASEEQFDAATSLLTLHFLESEARRQTVLEIVRRLKPGAPLIVAHCSFTQGDAERATSLMRYRAICGGVRS